VYLYSKPERIEGLEGGIYYYNPVRHSLALVTSNAQVDPSLFGLVNYQTFQSAAFALFLIGQLHAIEPLYGELSRDFCMLEAGLMTQLLETTAPGNHIALCQIGGVAFEKVQKLFALEKGALYLHCLLGGALDEAQENAFFSEQARKDLWIEEEL
jgi:SagB-type dehydrogenase family enzyme